MTNKSRSEDSKLAQDLDERTLQQWILHPNLKIIDNNVKDFKEKMNNVVNSISSLIDVTHPTIVHKHLIKGELDHVSLQQKHKIYKYTDQITFLLTNDPQISKSIGKRVYQGNPFPSYFQVKRRFGESLKELIEKQRMLSEKKYYDLKMLQDPNKHELKREVVMFLISNDKTYVQVQIEANFIQSKKVIELIRVKTDKENNWKELISSEIAIGEEITEDPKFAGINLADKS